MAEPSFDNTKPSTGGSAPDQKLTPVPDDASDTSDNSSAKEIYEKLHYEYRTGSPDYSDDDEQDDDDEEDPYQELFMNAYRSAPASSDEDDDGAEECTNNNNNNNRSSCSNNYLPAAKPLSLMEDWELWDCMDDNELKERLKHKPLLLQEITLKRKRKRLDENDDAGPTSEDLSDMMNRFVKYIRADPTRMTS